MCEYAEYAKFSLNGFCFTFLQPMSSVLERVVTNFNVDKKLEKL